ncbi:hypothetical protein [Sphingomonas sp. dw_22]|uniref:hypothetical protein n=1 Tax=Sphingomonas sp. dw_22 TaxID=2721175 RepID=UPI001BD2C354|nr:hypothetical protein [Sphingomonas sp. dw_22]
MAQPAVSSFHAPHPSQPAAREEEIFGASGQGPVAELQQMLAARIADWPSVGDPFLEGPTQRIDEFVSAMSRVAGYVCFGGAMIGAGILVSLM